MNNKTEQALTDALIDQIESAARESFRRHQRSIKGQTLTAADNYDWHLLHAAYQAGIHALRAQLAEAQAAQTINQYPPITTEVIYQHVQANQAHHFLRVSWKDGIDIEEPTRSVECLLHAYADAAREGWASPEEVQKLREALIECKRQAASMRIWNGMGWTYHPPQAKQIFDAAEAALAATKTGEQHDNFCT